MAYDKPKTRERLVNLYGEAAVSADAQEVYIMLADGKEVKEEDANLEIDHVFFEKKLVTLKNGKLKLTPKGKKLVIGRIRDVQLTSRKYRLTFKDQEVDFDKLFPNG